MHIIAPGKPGKAECRRQHDSRFQIFRGRKGMKNHDINRACQQAHHHGDAATFRNGPCMRASVTGDIHDADANHVLRHHRADGNT